MLSQAYLMNMQKNHSGDNKSTKKQFSPSFLNPKSPYKYTMNHRADILKKTMSRIPPRYANTVVRPVRRPTTVKKTTTVKKPTKSTKSVKNVKSVKTGETNVMARSSPKNALVSVVMVSDNQRKYIYHAIYTILKQSHKNLELIVVDNFSEDGTIEFVKNLNDNRIKIYSLKEKTTMANCYNLGIHVSKGEYITFQDPCYISISDRITRQLEQHAVSPGVVSIVGEQLNEEKQEIQGNYQSVMISRELLGTFGYLWDTEKFFIEYAKRLQKHGVPIKQVDDLFYIRYDTLSNGIANNEYHLDTLEEYQEDDISPEKKVEFEDLVKFGV